MVWVSQGFVLFHRHVDGLVSSYMYKYQQFDADQPIDDLALQGDFHMRSVNDSLSHSTSASYRNHAPFVPPPPHTLLL